MDETQPDGDQAQTPEYWFAVFRQLDEAVRNGDIVGMRTALGNPVDFPDTPLPMQLEMGGQLLHHAIYFAPVAGIGALLDAGASVKYTIDDNIPALFAAILSERDDRVDVIKLLLKAGADITQIGYNDWSPLHLAVNAQDVPAIETLVAHGADPYWRSGTDDTDTSAFDDALAMEFDAGIEAMLNAGGGQR